MNGTFFSTLTLVASLGLLSASYAQEPSGLMDAGEDVAQDYLELTNPVLSIWPAVNPDRIEAFDANLGKLIAVYESDFRNADANRAELKKLVDEAKKDEDIVKAKINVAKKAEDEAEKTRLEELKKAHESRRKYLDRIRKIREHEVKLDKVRVEYYRAFREGIEKARQLANERGGDQLSHNLLAIEKELIEQGKKIASLNDKVAGAAKKLNNEREAAYKERAKILDAM